MATRYLIIGGGVAGTTAAETIRSKDPEGAITIVSSEPHRLYSRIMLSKPGWFTGKIAFDQIWLKKPEWYGAQRITLLAGKRATRLDAAAKKVTLDDGGVLEYDKLLLALGTCPRKWGIPGAEKDGVFYLRTLDDGKRIIDAIETAKRAAVVGGGAIGLETCELLRMVGLEVTFVIREQHYWDPVLDATAGKMIEAAIEKHGAHVIRKQTVKEAVGGRNVEALVLDDGTRLECELVVVGIGGVCEIDTFRSGGVATERGIVANEYLETNLPDIWTAGDAAEAFDTLSEERVMYGSWNNAQQQGRTAGINMAGGKQAYAFVSTYMVQAYGISICFVGNVAPTSGRDFVSRGSAEKGYARLVMKNGRVVGATMVNRTAEVSPISKLIAAKTDCSARRDDLANPEFDLKSLLA